MSEKLLPLVKNNHSDYLLSTITNGSATGPFAHLAHLQKQVNDLANMVSQQGTTPSQRVQETLKNVQFALKFMVQREQEIPSTGVSLQEKLLLGDALRYRYNELFEALEDEDANNDE